MKKSTRLKNGVKIKVYSNKNAHCMIYSPLLNQY